MFKCATGIVRRINVNTLDLARELLFDRLESEQVVPKDESVIEDIAIGDAVRGVARLLAILQQDARLQLRPALFANPGEFEFSLGTHAD